MLTGKVYTLSDKDGNVFYVGCTTDTEQRLRQHLTESRGEYGINAKKEEMIRSVDYNVSMEILEEVAIKSDTESEARKELLTAERKWIDKMKDLGYELCNGILSGRKKTGVKDFSMQKRVTIPFEEKTLRRLTLLSHSKGLLLPSMLRMIIIEYLEEIETKNK